MTKESEPIPPSINLEFLNSHKLPLEKIKELQQEGVICRGSPHWWSTDYAPDPREFISIDEFRNRLIPVEENGRVRFHLYPHRFVPMTVIDLPIDGESIPFMVTARPYHPSSKNLVVNTDLLEEGMSTPISDVPQKLKDIRSLFLTYHCVPHVHGLFAGARGTHLFWYSLFYFPNSSFIPNISEALEKQGLAEIFPSSLTYLGYEIRSYDDVAEEISKKGLVARRFIRPDFDYEEVCIDEFLNPQDQRDYLVYYPLRLPSLQETLPLMVATKTHSQSRQRSPVVLGISAGTKNSHGKRDYFWRIKDYDFASSIATAVTADFGTKVGCVLFTPQGKPQYERVSP